jgi:hypothetical protein
LSPEEPEEPEDEVPDDEVLDDPEPDLARESVR